jgi:hypothetical protein
VNTCEWEIVMADGNWSHCKAHAGIGRHLRHLFCKAYWCSTRELKRAERKGYARRRPETEDES